MKSCWRAACVAALGSGACIKVPPFQAGTDAGADAMLDAAMGPPEVHWTDDGTGGSASVTGFYNVHFANGQAFHYPDGISINSVQLIGTNAAGVSCNGEDEVGFAVYPADRMAPHGDAMIIQNSLMPIWTGPAVVEIEVSVQTRYDGVDMGSQPATWQPSVVSRFSFHPDGRTYRTDQFNGSDGTQTTPNSVTCDSSMPGLYRVTSFTTLASMASTTTATVYSDTHTPLTPPLTEQVNQTDVCVDYGGMMQLAGAGLSEIQFRVRSPTASTIALVNDLISSAAPSGMTSSRSALFLSRGNACTNANSVQALVHRWQTTREQIFINNTMTEIQDDGIYGGFADNNPGGVAAAFPVTITGGVSMPFAVWLITPATADISVTKSPPTSGIFYLKQHDPTSTNWVIWFRDPLTAGDTITIDRL